MTGLSMATMALKQPYGSEGALQKEHELPHELHRGRSGQGECSKEEPFESFFGNSSSRLLTRCSRTTFQGRGTMLARTFEAVGPKGRSRGSRRGPGSPARSIPTTRPARR